MTTMRRPSGVEAGFHRTLAGSVVGAVLEWYEFAIYGALAATVFAGQFFPSSAPHTGILLAFGTQAVGFVAPAAHWPIKAPRSSPAAPRH